MIPFPVRGRATTALSIVVLAATLAIHIHAIAISGEREPHMDENEYLHAGWMMASGERLYETFFEHHSPLFFKTLEMLAPEEERVDVRPYFVRARWLCGTFGLLSLAAIAALLWRVGPEASAIAVALLVATGALWLRAFLEVRAETFALAFFCIGACMAMRWTGVIGGVGVGLVAVSCLWQPKWPLACVAVGLMWLVRSERRAAGSAAAVATAAAGFGAVALIVPLDLWWFFNFDVNVALARAVDTPFVMRWHFQGGVPFLFVPDAFHPWLVIPAALLVLGALAVARSVWRALPLLLLLAAFLEIRFVYPWPAIWSHYYLMWSVAAASVLGAVPSSLAILLAKSGMRDRPARAIVFAVTCTGLLLSVAHALAVRPESRYATTYWVSQKYLRERLRAGETVWIEASRHPVSVRDAHYYWFSVPQMTHAARELRKQPRGARYLPAPGDFPVCDPRWRLRYTLDPRRVALPGASECMQRLVETGEARPTIFSEVWEINWAGAP